MAGMPYSPAGCVGMARMPYPPTGCVGMARCRTLLQVAWVWQDAIPSYSTNSLSSTVYCCRFAIFRLCIESVSEAQVQIVVYIVCGVFLTLEG